MAAFGALAVMRCLGKSSGGPAITLTRVKYRSDFAARNYTVSQGAQLQYDYNEADLPESESSRNNISTQNSQESEINRVNSSNDGSRINNGLNIDELYLHRSVSEQSTYTPQIFSISGNLLRSSEVQIDQDSSSMDYSPTSDDLTSQNGVILISIRHFGDDLYEADNISRPGQSRQFSQSTDDVTQTRSTRSANVRSYNVIQHSQDQPSDDVISMRLTRSALSEELMSRDPPSYDLIVDLTDGVYVKPQPPSYDSIFQTNKL